MKKIEGKFLRQNKGKGFAARIKMEISESENEIIEFSKITDANNRNLHPNWLKGAEIGVKFALGKILNKKYHIKINEIIGTYTDTNPTIIGTATIFGIWNYLGMKIEEIEIERLTYLTLNSWNISFLEIPKYE